MKFERQSLIFKQNEVLIILCLVNEVLCHGFVNIALIYQ